MTRSTTAIRLVSTKEMDRQEWLNVRKQGIGSSDAAAAVGLNRWREIKASTCLVAMCF